MENIEKDISLYKIKLKISDVQEQDTIVVIGIIVGNIIKYKLKEFGLDIFNGKNLIDQVELINKIILKHFHD